MRIWYDACTGKHVRFGTAIARRLRKDGHEVVFTTREHQDTVALARLLGENPIVVGKYNPASLLSRLEESANRMIQFSKMFKDHPPDIAVSHQSVELCRVAFGLGVPVIITADTPYAEAVNRLTVPFSNVLLVSEAIPANLYKKYSARKIVRFKGVDEVAWTKNPAHALPLKFKRPLIVVRQIETKAAYCLGKEDFTIEAAHRLASLGTVVFLSRYSKPEYKNVIMTEEFVDSAILAGQADLVVSAGGTIAREAALQGTPSIVISEFGKIHVNEYLSKKKFPLFIIRPARIMEYAKRYLSKRFNIKTKLAELENPVDIIAQIISKKQFA
jgi:predicted glycosyltransferase